METIFSYSRAEAIADGVLVDISNLGAEAGIKYPVAITETLNNIVDNKPSIEDREGRLWDIVWMLKCAIQGKISTKKIGESGLLFVMILNDSNKRRKNPKEITLKAVVGPGDNLEPVITVMLPNED